VILLTIVQRSI